MTLVKVPVPWKGMDLSSEPDTLTAGKGALVKNLVPGRQGQLVPRGPITKYTATLKTSFDTGALGAGGFWISPDPSGSVYLQQAGTGATVSKNGGAPFAVPGDGVNITASFTRMGTYTVGCTGSGSRRLLTWDGSTTVVDVTNGPSNIEAVASHLNRVFAISTTTLYWTDPNPNLPANTAAMWQDDVTGLTNQIPLPAGEYYREIVVYNRVLYIIGYQSVYALIGDTPSGFTLRRVLEIGSATGSYGVPVAGYAGHATTTARGLYFWSSSGLVRFDGVATQDIGQDIMPRIAGGAWISLAALNDDLVSVITRGSWLLYHEPSASWTSLSSGAFPAATVHGGASGFPAMIRRTGSAWSAFSAGNNATSTSGVAAVLELSPDAAAARPPTLWNDNWDTVPISIDAQAVSASIRLSTPDRLAQIQRLYAQAGCGGWTVQVEDEAGVAIGPPATLVTGTKRARAESAPGFTENDIVRVRWTWDGTVGARLPSIGDAYLLTDAAQQR